jgi:hypothetical protein
MSLDANSIKSAVAESAVDGVPATLSSEMEIPVSKLPAAANGSALDDDELMLVAIKQLDEWVAADELPSLTAVQGLFHKLLLHNASPMVRDKVIDATIKKFGKEFGGAKALSSTWTQIAKQVAAERAEAARTADDRAPVTHEERHTLRQELLPIVRELAEAPDLLQRAVTDVHALGVVNEEPLIKAVLLTAVSRHLLTPLQLLVKGPSSSGKSFVTDQTLKLFHPSGIKHLTTTSPLSLVYDEEPLSHKLIAVFEATQIQSDPNSIFALLLRSLMSTGKLVHETTVEDPEAQYGRRTERIEREGPIATIITTTGEIHAENDTRMTSYFATSSEEQTQAVLQGVAARAAGKTPADPDLSKWHALDQWLSYGPQDAVVPFAESIVAPIGRCPVRFRRDIGGLFIMVKASALLHQAQRQFDERGRVIATIDDYVPAYEIFSHALAQAAGAEVPETVLKVIEYVASLTGEPEQPAPTTSTFRRAATMSFVNGTPASEVVLPSRKLARAIGLDPSTTRRAVKQAIDMGYLENRQTRRRQPARLAVLERPSATTGVGLPTPDELRRAASGCVKPG